MIVVMENLRARRIALKLSQIRLARLAGVSRWRICLHEIGDGPLSSEEERRINEAFRKEAIRMWKKVRRTQAEPASAVSVKGKEQAGNA